MPRFRIAGPICATRSEAIDDGTMCRSRSSSPGPLGLWWQTYPFDSTSRPASGVPFCTAGASGTSTGKKPNSLSVSQELLALLKQIEEPRLKPYDDQTGKDIKAWTKGATIGVGHLIGKSDWEKYKDGISQPDADALFEADLAPFVETVRSSIKVDLTQNQFDALVMLAFNIGPTGFTTSSVVLLVNDPKAKTAHLDLESAWKAWNKSQGKVMRGLVNRRACEWNVYSKGIYKRW